MGIATASPAAKGSARRAIIGSIVIKKEGTIAIEVMVPLRINRSLVAKITTKIPNATTNVAKNCLIKKQLNFIQTTVGEHSYQVHQPMVMALKRRQYELYALSKSPYQFHC